MDLARSLHGLCHNVYGCQGHCEGHANWGPCGDVLAWTTSDAVKKSPCVDHARTFFFCGFSKNADTAKPWYNVSLGTEILQHYIENKDVLRLFYMSTYGKGGNFSQRYNRVKWYIKVPYIGVSLYIYYCKPSVLPPAPPWSSWLGTGLLCNRLGFNSLQCHWFFF
jgi:hypothetical protein